MTKAQIMNLFETDFTNPGSYKSGEYLEEHVLIRAKRIVRNDRPNLIEVLREWLALRTEPKTMLAVVVARELRLTELKQDLANLSTEINTKKTFPAFYCDEIDDTVSVL